MHVKAFLPYPKASIIGSFSSFVALFMMVSAFSMCCGYYEKVKQGTIQPAFFYKRRYMRILPYFAFLCLLDLAIRPSTSALYELLANITLCFGLLPNPNMNMMGLGWFLGVIFVFYLLFPFFVYLIDNKHRGCYSLVISIVFSILAIGYFYKPPFVVETTAHTYTHNIIYYMPYFLIGGVVYLYREILVSYGKEHKALIVIMTSVVTVAYFITACSTKNEYMRFLLTLVVFSIWLFYAISTDSIFLNNKLTNFLSKISMEIYLAQMFIFRGVQMLHPEHYIQNDTLLYVTVSLLTLILLVPFTYITKYYIVDKVVDKLIKK
jgi:peptidoglycan/LPS O-acetylase OafA/YrhL